jgi:purine nucleosidase
MPQPVLMDHDGGVDDYLSTALLLTMERVRPIGIVVTPADCYLDPAVAATRKILDLMGRSDIPVAASTVRVLNAFPRIFRRDSFTVNHFPILNESGTVRAPLVAEPGQDFMVRALRAEPEPVVLLVTGPLTTVAAALDLAPDIEGRIKELLWMGGALDVPGNVDKIIEGGQDGTAEWNVYCDPPAAARVWETSIPITITPLDVTCTVPVTSDFVTRIARNRRYPLSDFAGQCYALVMHQDYYFWDVLTTAYLGRPDLFEVVERETVIVTSGPSQGRTVPKAGGRRVRVLARANTEAFNRYILEQWKR